MRWLLQVAYPLYPLSTRLRNCCAECFVLWLLHLLLYPLLPPSLLILFFPPFPLLPRHPCCLLTSGPLVSSEVLVGSPLPPPLSPHHRKAVVQGGNVMGLPCHQLRHPHAHLQHPVHQVTRIGFLLLLHSPIESWSSASRPRRCLLSLTVIVYYHIVYRHIVYCHIVYCHIVCCHIVSCHFVIV